MKIIFNSTLIFFAVIVSNLIVSNLYAPISYAFSFNDYIVERRKEQFDINSGYLVLPAPYNIPGVGEGIMLIGNAYNIFNTPIDTFLIGFTGDADGYVFSVDEAFIVPDFLYLNATSINVTKFGLTAYNQRGMASNKDDYNILIGDLYTQNSLIFNAVFFERRITVQLGKSYSRNRANKITDKDNNIIANFNNPTINKIKSTNINLLLDFTDDYNNPRKGIRYATSFVPSTNQDKDQADYSTLSHNLSFYYPVLEKSTIVFNYFRSDASVDKKGNTDLTYLQSKVYCDSQLAVMECNILKTQNALNTQSANAYGNALSLGGPDRLRSYPRERYIGAHSEFYGAEFRWNIHTEKANLDLYFLKDIMQSVQIVWFWEQGSVADTRADLGQIKRNSYGTGIRLITESGNVYRASFAYGDEGSTVILFFNYPWSL